MKKEEQEGANRRHGGKAVHSEKRRRFGKGGNLGKLAAGIAHRHYRKSYFISREGEDEAREHRSVHSEKSPDGVKS